MSVQILTGDCRDLLKTLPDESVHCTVTSPPYFGLRDYGTGTWEGGDSACDHIVGEMRTGLGMAALGERYAGGGKKAAEPKPMTAKDVCPHCGARRVDRQIGLELTPDAYVAEMVAVFRDVRRVLRSDGTLWLNLGDSYANDGKWGGATGGKHANYLHGGETRVGREKRRTGLKPKDLIGIPWRVALALQADGWWLRQDIIWHKPNPMPESVEDRCTKAHEYLFLLTKCERYAFDADAIAEPVVFGDGTGVGPRYAPHGGGPPHRGLKRSQALAARVIERSGTQTGGTDASSLGYTVRDRRNKRSVWTIATTPFAEAHFATFPPALIEPCILAGCPIGGTILDPFGGAGTTGIVANRLGRDAILIELNADYAAMAERRIAADRAGPVERARLRHSHRLADHGPLFSASTPAE